jgi:hypothetical protein
MRSRRHWAGDGAAAKRTDVVPETRTSAKACPVASAEAVTNPTKAAPVATATTTTTDQDEWVACWTQWLLLGTAEIARLCQRGSGGKIAPTRPDVIRTRFMIALHSQVCGHRAPSAWHQVQAASVMRRVRRPSNNLPQCKLGYPMGATSLSPATSSTARINFA